MLELTSPQLMWAARALLVAVTLWVIWRWGQSGQPGIYPVLRRLASLVGVSALVVLNLVLPLNAHYVWYSSWQDIHNATTGQTPIATPQATVGAAANIALTHPTPAPTVTPGTPHPRAVSSPATQTSPPIQGHTISHYEVTGPTSNHTGPVTVVLPHSYHNHPKRQYPVIWAFHGAPGQWQSMITSLNLDTKLTQEIAAKTISETIVVLPTWTVNGTDTECVNDPTGNPAIETWVAKDLPTWVKHQFRVIDRRDAWATLGVSAGGYCALMATVKHPTTFGSAIVLAGYTSPIFENTYRPFGPNDPHAAHYDLTALAAANPPPVAVWMLAPKPDPLAAKPATELAAIARPPLSVTVTSPEDGGHRMDVWTPYVAQALRWLGHNSPSFAPTTQ